MTELVFVTSPRQNAFFLELAELLVAEVNDLGGEARISADGFADAPTGGAFVLIPPHEYRAVEGAGGWPDRATRARTIFITAEQPGGKHLRENALIAADAGALFDINRLAVKEYRKLGFPFEHLPLGYSARLDRSDEGGDRDIDVLFMGCATDGRLRALASCADLFSDLRTRLLISDDTAPNGPSTPGFVSGERKLELLLRAKVLLNLHRGERRYFEWLRVLEAIHCGVAIVSEPSVDCDPLRPGSDFLEAEVSEIGRRCAELAADDGSRHQLTSAARRRLSEAMPLASSAERLLEAAESLRSAPVRRRMRAEVWAGGASAADALGVRSRALGSRLLKATTPKRKGQAVIAAAIKDLRLDLIEIERKTRALELNGSGAADRGAIDDVIEVTRTRPSDGSRPRVSVICALYNHAPFVVEALDSVAQSSYGSWELIVCDDGSRDESGSVVEDWIGRHAGTEATLLRHPVNRGLPAARNTCLARVSGEYVLVLDADNIIYPHCIERLVDALDEDPHAAFAYGILQQFDRGGPLGLSGFRDWEPKRLANENYIDALALIRADSLIELGGYTYDRRLYGWEDYDLWCRIAELGGYGTHVPEIVGRYRLAPGSMISLTNLSVSDARAALADHCPRLLLLAADGRT